MGHINVTKATLPLLKVAQGRIINTTSVLGRVTMPYFSAYNISKYGFEAFSDALRLELRPWGVSVHIIEPGLMRRVSKDHSSRMFDTAIIRGTETENIVLQDGNGLNKSKNLEESLGI